jgi:hemerythrin-like domain-containing protein
MSVFKELVEHHIEEEEGELFQEAEKVLGKDQMSDILKRFNDAKQKAKSSLHQRESAPSPSAKRGWAQPICISR